MTFLNNFLSLQIAKSVPVKGLKMPKLDKNFEWILTPNKKTLDRKS